MKSKVVKSLLFCIGLFSWSLAQITYKGTIGNYPIEMVLQVYDDGYVRGFYVYSKYDDPIILDGNFKNSTLSLIEKDKSEKDRAILTCKNFNTESTQIQGHWADIKTKKELKINLEKVSDIEKAKGKVELLQTVALKDKYFRLIVSEERGIGLKIFSKKTDQLFQEISLSCDLMNVANVDTGDFNFDHYTDFSVFEQSFAGPNTSSLYFLYNAKTGKYDLSSFEGTSLEFDSKKMRIFEHNECCAGQNKMTAEYKVVNNQMVLIKKTCLKYNEKKQDFDPVPCEEE